MIICSNVNAVFRWSIDHWAIDPTHQKKFHYFVHGLGMCEPKEAAVDEWLRRWICTQWTWFQLPPVTIQVVSGSRKNIRPELLPFTSNSPSYLGRQVRAIEQGSQRYFRHVRAIIRVNVQRQKFLIVLSVVCVLLVIRLYTASSVVWYAGVDDVPVTGMVWTVCDGCSTRCFWGLPCWGSRWRWKGCHGMWCWRW